MIRAVFGGSFDPFHRGHLAMVLELASRGLADVVHVAPAYRSPFKDGTSAPPADRLAMTRASLDEVDGVRVEDLEVERGGACFTIETLDALRERHPDDEWKLVVGADSLDGLPRWRDADRLLDGVTLLVFPRDGEAVQAPSGSTLQVVDDFAHDVSSSDVRRSLAGGIVPADLLPPAVARIIRERGLYGIAPGGDPCP